MDEQPSQTCPADRWRLLVAAVALLATCTWLSGQAIGPGALPAPAPGRETDTDASRALIELGPDGELRIHLAAAAGRLGAGDSPPRGAKVPPDAREPLDPAETGWVWFTGKRREFPHLLADQREAHIRTGFSTARHGNSFADVVIGGDVNICSKNPPGGPAESLTVRGVFTARFKMNSMSTDLLNTDYIIGMAHGWRFTENAFELFIYHQSSHLGDETLDFGHRARIDYAREAVRFMWAHDFTEDFRIYGGPTFNFSGEPDFRHKTTVQFGGEYWFAAWGRPMYVAADVQARETNDWRPALNTQVGVVLGDPERGAVRPRLFLEFFTGYSNMGQYWNVYETSLLLGLGYDW